MFGRQLKTRFDFMFPNIQDRVEERQVKQKSNFDNRVKEHTFDIGDTVYAKNFHHGNKGLPARVVRKLGNVIYEVELETFRKQTRRHLNQLQPCSASVSPEWDDMGTHLYLQQ